MLIDWLLSFQSFSQALLIKLKKILKFVVDNFAGYGKLIKLSFRQRSN